ncbi:MAG: hypothetical protein JNM24_07050 [Bdellovibrionaceae bacterium]|nr:hypothetical protein [Pseudobdellovibrionaceae bacterium]
MKNNRALIISLIIHVLVSLCILNLFFTKPIAVPFVDDWILMPWATGQVDYTWNNFWQMMNGHQHNLMKLYTILMAQWFSLSLPLSSIIQLAIGSAGFFIISWSQIKDVDIPDWAKIATMAGFSFIGLSWRQMQNFFMLICLPWMLAILFIGCYFYIKNRNGKNKTWLLSLIILLSPMSFALGLIVPLSQIAESAFNFARNRFKFQKIDIYFGTLSLFSIFLSFGYPTLTGNVIAQNHSPLAGNSVFSIFEYPLDFPKFILLAIGQPFVVWFSTAADLGIAIGAVIAVLLSGVVFYYRKNTDFIFQNKTSLLAGSIFLLMFYAARYKLVGVAGAIEPRYSTASLVFLIGALATILKLMSRKTVFSLVILIIGGFVQWRGLLVGESYYDTRYRQGIEIQECFKNNGQLPIDMTNPCVKALYPGEWLNQESYLSWVIELKKQNLIFFR